MWTPTTRARRSRAGLRYGSDPTDGEWAVLEPSLPVPCRCGRPRRRPLREVVNAIFYVPRCSCPWRLLPKDLPPWRTAYRRFARLRDAGTWEALNFALVAADRERSGRAASPSAAAMDSQSVRTTGAGGPRGHDAGKKVWGRKRHALADTDGRALVLHAHPASVQDRDGAVPLLKAPRGLHPFIERAFADAAHNARRVAEATLIAVEIARRKAGQAGFAVQPRRCPGDGSSNGPSPGSAATGASPAASELPPRPPLPSSTPPPQCCSPAGSAVLRRVRAGRCSHAPGSRVHHCVTGRSTPSARGMGACRDGH